MPLTDDGWFVETLHRHHRQQLKVEEVLYHDRTDHQDLVIFSNSRYGRIMALDGVVQVTELDNGIYHEMLTHVPLIGHGAARHVLVIGGGDGGMLRHVLMHPGVLQATLVEIDQGVIDFCQQHLPGLSQGVFQDPRVEVVIDDGAAFVATTDRRFDVIIVDSTDPEGPGAALFTQAFYANCRRCLQEPGILVTQNGVPWDQPGELTASWRAFGAVGFADRTAYVAPVPTYSGGHMAFGFAATAPGLRPPMLPGQTLAQRVSDAALGETTYYTADIHTACFALPAFVERLLVD